MGAKKKRSGMAQGDVAFGLAERRRTVSAFRVALNPIGVGCLPEYKPFLPDPLETMAEPDYNFHSSAGSTGGAASFR